MHAQADGRRSNHCIRSEADRAQGIMKGVGTTRGVFSINGASQRRSPSTAIGDAEFQGGIRPAEVLEVERENTKC